MESTETAIRMVGQLLLHHPTTGTMFRDGNGEKVDIDDEAETLPSSVCSFCYVGAVRATAWALNLDPRELWDQCDTAIGQMMEGEVWDTTKPRFRNSIARKLANYKGTL